MSFFSGERLLAADAPPPLNIIVAIALTQGAYSRASQDRSFLENLLLQKQQSLHQGDTISADSTTGDGLTLTFRLEVLEPVSEGYATAKTKIILLSSKIGLPSNVPYLEDVDAIEIDEGFLAKSVLGPGLEVPKRIYDNPRNLSITRLPDHYPSRFTLKSLDAPENPLEDHCTLYLRTADLGRLGILSGDWVSSCLSLTLRSLSHSEQAIVNSTRSRLVRLVANDGILNSP